MPNIDSPLSQISGATCFASLDFCHEYWQLPLDRASQECQSFIFPDGVYSPTRVFHGQTNAVAHYQSSILALCTTLRESLLQWLDDILAHSSSPDELISLLARFFAICGQYGLKRHSRKCRLFLREVNWCGRLLSKAGIRLDPRRIPASLEITESSTGADLQQFVCATNWMRYAIPTFNKLIDPLFSLL